MAIVTDTLASLLPDWQIHLRSRNVAPSTVASYTRCALALADALGEVQLRSITRRHVEAHLAARGDTHSPADVAKHYRSLQQLFRWLVEDGELKVSPMSGMRPPQVPVQPVPVLSDDALGALLRACAGHEFRERRDTAIVRLLVDSGLRAGELCGLGLADVDQELGTVYVVGKGRKGRAVPYGARTGEALRRYLRARRGHPNAALGAFWLGRKGALSTSGLAQMLDRRCSEAGLPHVHPHQFRHTFAHQWLAAGGQEQDLQRLAGWSSPQMVGRYGASAGHARALDAHRRLQLGDRL